MFISKGSMSNNGGVPFFLECGESEINGTRNNQTKKVFIP